MIAAIYGRLSSLWDYWSGAPAPNAKTATEKAFRELEQDLQRERRRLMGRTVLWTGAAAGTLLAAERTKAIPPKAGVAIAAIGLLEILYSIRYFGSSPVSKACRAAACRERGERRRTEIPDFPLPAHLEAMCERELGLLNAGQPLRYFADGGGRIGIAIDANALPLDEILRRIRIILHRYPHMARIQINNAPGDGFEWADDLGSFQRLAYLSFNGCAALTDEGLAVVAAQCPFLKRIDLKGCSGLSDGACRKLARDLAVTFPDGTSNLNGMLDQCYEEITDITKRLLQGVIAIRKRELQARMASGASVEERERNADIEALERILATPKPPQEPAREERRKAIEALMARLADFVDPARLGAQEKQALIEPLKREAEEISRQTYFAALDSPFHLHLHNLLMCDELFEPMLHTFCSANAYLISLDLSKSLIEGQCLKDAMGLPIVSLNLSDLRKFDPSSLRHLIGYHELKELNVSRTCVDSQWLLRGIMPLIRLESLRLDQCPQLSDAAVCSVVKNLRRLELLTVVGNPQITRRTISTLIERGGEDESKPFVILWGPLERRRLEISAPGTVDKRTLRHLQEAGREGSVSGLGFGSGCRLKESDAQEFVELPFLQIDDLDLDESRFELGFLQRLVRKWPLRTARAGQIEIEIGELAAGSARRIAVRAPQGVSVAAWQFLEAFEAIHELSLAGCQNLPPAELLKLAAFCKAKKVEKLDLSQTRLANEDLELLTSEPKPVMKDLLSQCDFINLQGSNVTEMLFGSWKWDLACSHPFCVIRIADGRQKQYACRQST